MYTAKKGKTKKIVRLQLFFMNAIVKAVKNFSIRISVYCVIDCVSIMGNRKRISLSEKIKILDDCKSGLSLKAISYKYGISKSSICTLKKMESKILTTLENTNNIWKNRRFGIFPFWEYPKMEEKLRVVAQSFFYVLK